MKILILSVIASVVVSCSWISPPTTGATDNPNFIRGTVVDTKNRPVENAEIVVRNHKFTSNGIEIIEERMAISDTNGNYTISGLENNRFSVFVTYESKSHLIGRFETIGDSTTIPVITVNRTATIQGRVLGAENVKVSIAGFPHSAITNTQGEYTLDSVPAGKFDIVFSGDDFINVLYVEVLPSIFSDTIHLVDVEINRNVIGDYTFFGARGVEVSLIGAVFYHRDSLPQWYYEKDFSNVNYLVEDGITTTRTDYLGRPFVVIDDFEYHNLVPLVDVIRGGRQSGTNWFFFANPAGDSIPGSHFLPEGVVEDESRAIVSQDAFRGNSFHVSVVLSAENLLPFAGFGVSFDENYDMTNLEEISFYARGRGTLSFAIWTGLVFDYPEGNNWGHFGRSFSLTDQWQRYVLPIAEFAPRAGSIQQADGIQWSQARDRVSGFEFITEAPVGDTISIWLDEINFIGTNF